MQFCVGDKVMHPRLGAGGVTGEQHRELVDGFEHYYVIQLLSTRATVYVPVSKVDELGVRPIISRAQIVQVFKTLRGEPNLLSKNHKERQALVQEQLETCQPVLVAEAIRDLTWRKRRKHLTMKDEHLLRRGLKLLAGEMALATDTQISEAQETIEVALRDAVDRESGVSPDEQGSGSAPAGTQQTLASKLPRSMGRDKEVSARA